ncbi:MAG: filamentous hemagglutinin N-terminal domain-containing protein, partial [Reinekea sp.]|nr:filamentous hemagglutinin N-terminal domain-containing protein [Reinekea sp.]
MKQTLIVSLLTLASTTWANPELEQIVSGEVSLTTQDNTLTVHQSSDAAWIDWHSFSIAEQETVIFQLLNAQGLSVNRVTGDDVSSLFGQLQSNGTVYLINPNGILFGEHARVDVGGLFATDHWLDEQGNLTPSSHSSGIQVLGTIQSREQLTLLANGVTNAGHLSADTVNLLANEGALLSLDETGAVSVLVPTTSGNSWVEHSGVIVANGRVYIGSADTNSWLNQLAAENQVTVSGQIQADQITVRGTDVELLDAQLSAALIDIESRDTTYLSGADVTSTNGNVRIRGDEIQVFNGTTIDVGSGELTVGGRLQGQGHDHNANFVHVSSTVHLYGNGGELGNGGEIIIWSDGSTSFHGTIQAQGGSQGGDGGFVEVSGKETLVFRGNVDTTAAEGKTGTLLLDPTDIIIADGSGGANDGAVSDGIIASGDAPATMTISEQALENLSSATNITLQASQSITINDLS